MSKEILLVIDNGTQSVRALLFDLQGNLLDKAQIELEAYFSRQPGWAEQEPEYFWEQACAACRKLWANTEIPREAIAGVAVTTQRGTIVNVDAEGRPLRPAIIWLDQRQTSGLKPVGGLWGLAFRLVRMRDTVSYLQSEAECNWIRVHQPKIWEKTHRLLLLSGWLNYKLCGRFVDSVGNQVAYLPFDYKRLTWARSWDWKWQALPMSPDLLPDLEPPGSILGEITPEAAEATGIPAGLPLLAAAADKACEVLGSGALEPHVGCLSYGTTATINATHKKYVEVIPLIPPYPSAVPGAYSVEVQIYRGFWMVSWFKREFGLRERQLARERGVEPEQLFDHLVERVPAGSLGLMLQPFWSPGIKVPGPEAKGAVLGFGDVHTRAHLYRAILEGIAYALREGTERIEKRSGAPVTELRVSGGGSQSAAAVQIAADVFGRPALRPHTFETSGLGAAIVSAVGLGLQPDFSTAVREMTHVRDVFEPDPTTHELYNQLYERVYKKIYGRLKPLYEDIRDITGYPK